MQDDIVRQHTNARMSKIVQAQGLIFLCGQTSSGSDVADIGGQTRETLSRVDRLLAEAGSSRDRILSATVYLRSIDDFDAMNAEWEAWVPKGSAPARTTVEAKLASSNLLVEVTVTALRGLVGAAVEGRPTVSGAVATEASMERLNFGPAQNPLETPDRPSLSLEHHQESPLLQPVISRGVLMKALVKWEARLGLWVDHVPIPPTGPDDVLIKISKTGICRADIDIYRLDDQARRTIPFPTVVGHEYAGKIVEVGANVCDLVVGQRVSGECHMEGRNRQAARSGRFHLSPGLKSVGANNAGAFSEYVCVPPSTSSRCRTSSTTRSVPSWPPSVAPSTLRCLSTSSARTCSSPARGRSAS